MGILNGLTSKLDPDLNIIEIATPYAKRFAYEDKGWMEKATSRGKEIGAALINIPEQFENILRLSNRGEFHMYITAKEINNLLGRIYTALNRLVILLSIIIFILTYTYFQNQGRFIEGLLSGVTAVVFVLILICSFLKK
jgi:predicted unusual protein kinase regulating ubiquinone biosynthesis (AarF/ABC1/UbiB family)